MKHLAICSFYGLKLQRNVHYITMSQLCISHGLTFFSEALCWYTSCTQIWFFDWITIFPHWTTVCTCTLHFCNQYIVIETRKNGQPTSVWKKDFDKLWSPSKFRNSFFKVKISKLILEYPFTSTTSKTALPNILKIASNHRISSRQGLIRSINPWWASKLIQIFLPDTCEPPSKKVYILCLTNVLTLSPPPELQSWMKSEGADNSTLLWLDIWYLNDISMLTSRVNLSNW